MKKWIITRKQKQKLLHDLKSNIYTTLNIVESWIKSCETRDQLQSIINFLDYKVSQYDYILGNYNIAFWYTNSIYNEIKEYLFSHMHQIEDIHNGIANEITEYELEIEKLKKKSPTIRGFEKIFHEEED